MPRNSVTPEASDCSYSAGSSATRAIVSARSRTERAIQSASTGGMSPPRITSSGRRSSQISRDTSTSELAGASVDDLVAEQAPRLPLEHPVGADQHDAAHL